MRRGAKQATPSSVSSVGSGVGGNSSFRIGRDCDPRETGSGRRSLTGWGPIFTMRNVSTCLPVQARWGSKRCPAAPHTVTLWMQTGRRPIPWATTSTPSTPASTPR